MVIFLCFILCCCQSEQNPVYELLEFRTEVKNHCADYSEADWENAMNRYSEICERLDKMEFTKEERLEIDKVKGEIAGYAATVAAQQVSDEIQNIASEIESFANGFSKTFQSPKINE